jgi:hypothetical protein
MNRLLLQRFPQHQTLENTGKESKNTFTFVKSFAWYLPLVSFCIFLRFIQKFQRRQRENMNTSTKPTYDMIGETISQTLSDIIGEIPFPLHRSINPLNAR